MHSVQPKRILITGAFGYLGGRLAQKLSAQKGYEVIMASSREQIESNGFSCVQLFWKQPEQLYEICNGVDIIIHAAGMNAEESIQNPEKAIEVNALYTMYLMQAAIKQKVKRFIYFSSAHIYNNPLEGFINEDTCPRTLHPYATSHRAGEDVIKFAHSIKQIEGIVIRMSNSFGPPVNVEANCWKLFVNDLCLQGIRSGVMILKSNVQQQRNFIALSEVTRAVSHLMEIPSIKLGNGVFNLGSNWNPSLYEMAQKIQQVFTQFDRPVRIVSLQPETQNYSSIKLKYSIDKIINSGFQPLQENFIDEELHALISFCLQNNSIISA